MGRQAGAHSWKGDKLTAQSPEGAGRGWGGWGGGGLGGGGQKAWAGSPPRVLPAKPRSSPALLRSLSQVWSEVTGLVCSAVSFETQGVCPELVTSWVQAMGTTFPS